MKPIILAESYYKRYDSDGNLIEAGVNGAQEATAGGDLSLVVVVIIAAVAVGIGLWIIKRWLSSTNTAPKGY